MEREFEVFSTQLFIIPSFSDEPLRPEEDPFELSIQKWQAIVDALAAGQHVTAIGGTGTCALCQMPGGWWDDCRGCPLTLYADSARCRNDEFLEWRCAVVQQADIETLLQAARNQLGFLRHVYQHCCGGGHGWQTD